jgi:hypothetical protein
MLKTCISDEPIKRSRLPVQHLSNPVGFSSSTPSSRNVAMDPSPLRGSFRAAAG